MTSRINEMRVLGLPLQFVVVVAVSLVMTIYLGAWAADSSIDARRQERLALVSQNSFPAPGASLTSGVPGSASNQQSLDGEVQQEAWEHAFLFACPLH